MALPVFDTKRPVLIFLKAVRRPSVNVLRACQGAAAYVLGAFGSTCPPNPLRIAEMIFSAKVWPWRERKRV
jgi:hypothetical protein